ncbi:MAG: energy-coupling factor transporter ATPase [Clostridiales bacterium]|nr:energy-coupling factor transporter ATPase [Clostridiales bacterium]
MSISIKKLNYVYDADSPFSVAALEGVDFCVNDNEFVCIIGHTGSGKSTLVQHLNGILKPTNVEEMIIEGIDLTAKKPDYKSLRQKVGMVFQYPEYQLFEQTVRLDIGFGPKNMGLTQNEIDERVIESAKIVGLDESVLEMSPFELSGGQKRRAAIAGVLSMRPQVLVLDEPIAGLDPKGKAEILQVISNYHKKYNATIIMISHNMDDIVEVADRVVVMHKGKKALDGTPQQVFSNYETILSLGLELPTVSALVKRLNEIGKNVPRNICKINDLVNYVSGVKK